MSHPTEQNQIVCQVYISKFASRPKGHLVVTRDVPLRVVLGKAEGQ